jgi:CubicO group peptidase (beta-lactamase class C family)
MSGFIVKMVKKRVATATSCAVQYHKKEHERIGGDAMIRNKELTLFLEQLEKEYHFSGTLLVAQNEETVFEQAYGFASRQLNVPNRLETKFHIGRESSFVSGKTAAIVPSWRRMEV